MRRVNITKQDMVQPKAVIFGLSIKQMVIMGTGLAAAVGTFCALYFGAGADVNIVMSLVFAELIVFAGFSIIRVNGINFFTWLINIFAAPRYLPYQSKGVKSSYDIRETK